MKKVLITLVFALVATCLVAPKFIASKYQEKVTDIVKNIDNETGYSATIESTESSWFGSKTKVLLSFDMTNFDPSFQGKNIETELVLNTHYGPLLFSSQGVIGLFATDIQLQGEKQRQYLDWAAKSPLYNASIVSGLFGDLKFADNVPAFSNKMKTLMVSQYSGHGKLTAKKLTYDGGFKEATSNDQIPTTIKDVKLALNLDANWATIRSEGFYNGDMSLKVGKVSTEPKGELDGLTVTLKTKLNDKTQLGSMQIGYAIKKLTMAGFQANDLNLVTELDNLNNQVFLDYGQLVKSTTNLTPRQQFGFLQDNIEPILSSKPEFNIVEFSGSTKDGHFTSSLNSKLADVEAPTFAELNDPRFWLYNAIINTNIEADKPLLDTLMKQYVAKKMFAPVESPEVQQQSTRLIDTLLQQGIIKLKDDKYLSEFHAEKGQGKIYDQTFPIM